MTGRQLELPVLRPGVRKGDPETSGAAAQVAKENLGRIQAAVLEAFQVYGPMTARKAERLPCFETYGFSTIRKRISELAQGGRLREIGIDRSGRAPATIYALKLPGEHHVTQRANQ